MAQFIKTGLEETIDHFRNIFCRYIEKKQKLPKDLCAVYFTIEDRDFELRREKYQKSRVEQNNSQNKYNIIS